MSSAVRDRTARARIREYLACNGSIVDAGGRATAVLKEAVGYQGSPVAFIQLLSAMDKDSEITREIRGKRTYSVSGPAGAVATGGSASVLVTRTSGLKLEVDYDEFARALVREAVRVLAATSDQAVAPVRQLTTARAERDKLIAERDEYARRLEIARRQLNALISEPVTGGGREPAEEAQGRNLLAQLADEHGRKREEQAS